MRILFLTLVMPYPLDAGPKIRAYHMLEYLAARHQVTLVSFVRDSDSEEDITRLRSLCRDVHIVPLRRTRMIDIYSFVRSVLSRQPFTIIRDERREMRDELSELIASGSFDAIHADQLSMAGYAISAREVMFKQHAGRIPLMVLDAHNAYYLIPQRMADVTLNPLVRLILRREARLIARYEADTYRQFDHVLTVTNEDQACIKSLMPTAVDHPLFTTIPICVAADVPCIEREADAKGLILLGGLHWPPNADAARWFTREIWPRVKSHAPHAILYIVGTRPPDDIRALGDFVGIDRPEQAGDASLVVTGYLKDPTPFIRASAVLVVALRSGGGMRVKIVEAMQWGLPVVSTTIGCEGINVTPGQDAVIADDPEVFAESLVRVLCERAMAQKLVEGGRRLITQQYNWRKAYASLDEIYQPGENATHT